MLKTKQKLTELESKIPDVSSSATKAALTAVENKIPDVSSVVKKQSMTQKSVSLIMIMTSILPLQSYDLFIIFLILH